MAAPASQRMSFSFRTARPSSFFAPPSSPTRKPSASPSLSPSTSGSTRFSSPAQSAADYSAAPPSPLSLSAPRKSLTIDPDLPPSLAPSSSSSSSFLSALRSRAASLSLSSGRRDRRAFLTSTPKGADAAAFPHFCPICYRHFPAVLQATCCQHHICEGCVLHYLALRQPEQQPPLKAVPEQQLFLVACPCCNQQNGVVFEQLRADEAAQRTYVESPRTVRALMRREEAARREERGELVTVAA